MVSTPQTLENLYHYLCEQQGSPQTQRGNIMANSEWSFEEIEETEITAVARGRKSNVDEALIEGLRNLKTGKAIRIPSQQLDTKAANYKTEKARVSAMLRTAMRAAGHSD